MAEHWYGNKLVCERNTLQSDVIYLNTLGSLKLKLDKHMTNGNWV